MRFNAVKGKIGDVFLTRHGMHRHVILQSFNKQYVIIRQSFTSLLSAFNKKVILGHRKWSQQAG